MAVVTLFSATTGRSTGCEAKKKQQSKKEKGWFSFFDVCVCVCAFFFL